MPATNKKNVKTNVSKSETGKKKSVKNKVDFGNLKEVKTKSKATNKDKGIKSKQIENTTKKNNDIKKSKSKPAKTINDISKTKSKATNKDKENIIKSKKVDNKNQKVVKKNKLINFFDSKIKNKLRFNTSNEINKTIQKKTDTKGKKKDKEKNNTLIKKSVNKVPLFTEKSKKYLIIVAVICIIILLLEFGYFLYHRISFDARNTYYDTLNSLIIDNSDIVAVGSSNFKYSKFNSYTNGLEKAKLIKYDDNGKIILEKMYDKGINTIFNSILNVDDGYIVVGSGVFSEEEQSNEAREALIVKYDKDGNVVWEKFYQVVTNTSFNKVIATNDGYVAIGQSIYANMEMGNHTTGGGIIVKYDKDGNEIWCNNHGGMKSGNFNDIVEVNGDFYVVGKDASDSANLVKFNANGEYEWHKNYSYTDSIGFSGIAYLNNYLYVVGSKKILPDDISDDDNRDTTNTDGLLVKYDLDGKVIFEKTFGGSNYERYNSIIAHRNYLYVVGHTTSSDIGFKVVTDGKLMTGLVLCYDEDGNINKKEIFGGSHNDNLTDIVTDGGSLYITGYSNSSDGNIVTSHDNGKDYFGKIIQIDYRFRTNMVK